MLAAPGDYVSVTTDTRVLEYVNEYGIEDYYCDGYTVYCLEHNLSGPGEGSGSNQTAKGPYVLVDMNYFVNNSGGGGVSGVRFSAKTMHALAWVLRHTYSVSGEVIRVKINEAYVVPDEMRKFVNYTTIQTGVNLAVTGVMWVGIGLMVISGAVGLIRKRRAG